MMPVLKMPGRVPVVNSKAYVTPRRPYEKPRLDQELKLIGEFGLRNKREVWRVKYTLAKIRKAARELLTLEEKHPRRLFEGNALLRRLVRIGVLDESRMKLDYVLGLKIEDFLERRLQTQVFKLGLAKSIHHARVLIRQRHIRVRKQVVNVPSFMVRLDSQKHIDFSLKSPFGGGRPGRVKRKNMRKAQGGDFNKGGDVVLDTGELEGHDDSEEGKVKKVKMNVVRSHWKLRPIIGPEYHAPMTLRKMYAYEIKDRKDVSSVLQAFNKHFPFGEWKHLKRVKSTDLGAMILWTDACDSSPSLSPPNDVSFKLGALKTVNVPQSAPLTREQFREACKHWPVHFHEDKHISMLLNGKFFTIQDLTKMELFMQKALDCANENSSSCGTVIVDPKQDIVVGRGTDQRRENPRLHSVMVAIEEVAEHISATDDSGYICTGFDVYCTREPCMMCAMALIHSRVRRLLPGEEEDGRREKTRGGPWTWEYYQQFFDVDTEQVKQRTLWAMIPRPSVSYLEHYIRPNPDLYGPFWIGVTLVFSIAVMGNLSNYLATAATGNYVWRYDFHKVSYAATAVLTYIWLLPIGLYAFLRYRMREGYQLTFLEIISVYGYSLAIYIPISILWMIQVNWLQWLLVILGSVMSGLVLVSSLWPAVKDDPKRQVAIGVLSLVVLFHFLLAVGFMMYFFHAPKRIVEH
ncbi:unnamed protein product [Darwinula stevensoni]|uniref:Small ribosomal subunit protein uS4 n=1 Tax=Darwinula stevensoni TaxID=69355 RepID=A0A7R8X0Q1_9CRUS|nr:unnamed protein product [Darwinula stevensoni]CAG0881914.1 unnamed protein product [Darwinula stevensoni]